MNLSIEVKFVLALLLLAGVTMLRLEAIERGRALYKGGNEAVAEAAPYGVIGKGYGR
jgi:hypothetical protein